MRKAPKPIPDTPDTPPAAKTPPAAPSVPPGPPAAAPIESPAIPPATSPDPSSATPPVKPAKEITDSQAEKPVTGPTETPVKKDSPAETAPPEEAAATAPAKKEKAPIKKTTGKKAPGKKKQKEKKPLAERSPVIRAGHFGWTLAKELWNEHEFWVHALAVKGGFSAMVVAGIVATSSLVALPFLASAGVIAGVGALTGIGLYGIIKGAKSSWQELQNIWARARGRTPKPRPVKPPKKGFWEKLAEKPWVKRMAEKPWVKRMAATRTWKVTKRLTDQDSILGGIAVGGGAISLVLGGVMLATQVAVLPVVAAGSLLTVGTVMAAWTLIGGITGTYFSIVGIKHQTKRKKEEALARKAAKVAAEAQNTMDIAATPRPAPANEDTPPALAEKEAAADFDKAAAKKSAAKTKSPAEKPAAAAKEKPKPLAP